MPFRISNWLSEIIEFLQICGSLRCRSPYPKVLTVFKTGLQAAVIKLPFAEDTGNDPAWVLPQPRFSKPVPYLSANLPYLAEKEGFEPPVPFGTLVFKTSAISQTLPFLLCSLRRIRTLIS